MGEPDTAATDSVRSAGRKGDELKADLRYCGVCWAGRDGVRLHYCDEPLGHAGDHRCHCGETLKKLTKLVGRRADS
jgi:hypothetical protein